MSTAKYKLSRTHRKLAFQPLESRSMMAGDVAVAVVNGDLRVTGDGAANDIAIVQEITNGRPVAGSFFVTGTNNTTINGGAGTYFRGVSRDLSINLSGGNDHLTLGDGQSDFHFNVPNDLRIDMGNGDNGVKLNRIAVRDDATINTGTGRDTLNIHGRFGASAGVDGGLNDLKINTGNGTDIVHLRNAFVRHNLNINAAGTDRGYDLVDLAIMNVGHDISISTGDGRDTVTIDQVGANHSLFINTGADIDFVQIKSSEASNILSVSLGAGQDELQISDTFGTSARLNGGDGLDRVFEHTVDFTNGQEVLNFEPNFIQSF